MPDFMRNQTGSPKTERVEFAAQNEKYEFSQRGVHWLTEGNSERDMEHSAGGYS